MLLYVRNMKKQYYRYKGCCRSYRYIGSQTTLISNLSFNIPGGILNERFYEASPLPLKQDSRVPNSWLSFSLLGLSTLFMKTGIICLNMWPVKIALTLLPKTDPYFGRFCWFCQFIYVRESFCSSLLLHLFITLQNY